MEYSMEDGLQYGVYIHSVHIPHESCKQVVVHTAVLHSVECPFHQVVESDVHEVLNNRQNSTNSILTKTMTLNVQKYF